MAGGRRARNAVVRQATNSMYDAAQQRAHDIAQEICDEVARERKPRITGALLNSYYVVQDSNGDALIKSRVPYWKYVEFGTGHGTEQPHLRPAIEDVRMRHS